MKALAVDPKRIRGAWEGRISGCQLGRPLELLSMFRGREGVRAYLEKNDAWPLRDYVPYTDDPFVAMVARDSCREYLSRSEPDDDINYTVLALMMLEEHGLDLTTQKVAAAWLKYLPAAYTFCSEKAAYRTLLNKVDDTVLIGLPPNFDLEECSDNPWSDWIGAQIRADMYGWVCPGRPGVAAGLARCDAALSSRGEAVHGAAFIAALAAAVPAFGSIGEAIDAALAEIPADSKAAEAVGFGRSIVGRPDAVEMLHEKYKTLPPAHALNNLALVVWGLLSGQKDFSAAIGDTVTAGWDTDCNGATVGGFWGLSGQPVPQRWTAPWNGRVAVTIAGVGELALDDLVERTVTVADKLSGA